MDNSDEWTKKVTSEISEVEDNISPSERRYYRLPLLLRSARRVAAFYPECEVCQNLQIQIIDLSANLADLPQMNGRSIKKYLSIVKTINRHLRRRHGLVEARHYIKLYGLIGLTFGSLFVVLSLILLDFGITLLALNATVFVLISRVITGCTIGFILDRRAKKQNRVI
jgi:hypothetical protein